MDQIPNSNSNKAELQKQAERERYFSARFWIVFAITIFVLSAMTFIVFMLSFNLTSANEPALDSRYFHAFSDATFISGFLGLLIYIMSIVAAQGTFDMLAYSMQVFFLNIFRPSYRKSSFPENFYEYKKLKGRNKRKRMVALFYSSVLFIAAGFILYLLWRQSISL